MVMYRNSMIIFLKLCPNSINPIKYALWATLISIFLKTPQIRENLKKTLCVPACNQLYPKRRIVNQIVKKLHR